MANTNFDDYKGAHASLKNNKFGPSDWKGLTIEQKDIDMDLAAKIAVFLCNPQEFDRQLGYISEAMWKRYIVLDSGERNKFSRVISQIAEPFTFYLSKQPAPPNPAPEPEPERVNQDPSPIAGRRGIPMTIKLVGGDPQLGFMLRNKMFWKDSMEVRHGEYTHALQWLAIANKFGRPAAVLYSRLGNYHSISKDGKKVYLWQWLADCFPTDMKNLATETLENGETLESQSFRSPQCITDYLITQKAAPLKGHFVSAYLCMRYEKRGWLKDVDANGRKLPVKTLAGNAIGNANKKKENSQWKDSTKYKNLDGKPVPRWERHEDHGKLAVEPRVVDGHDVIFHGIPGKLWKGA